MVMEDAIGNVAYHLEYQFFKTGLKNRSDMVQLYTGIRHTALVRKQTRCL